MAPLVIQPVTTKRQQRDFLEFPWRHYDRDPFWVPPLWQNQAELTGIRPHPFYQDNQVQLFLASRGGHVVGRVAAIVNHEHNELHEPRGFVGFFESENRQETANGLFDAARQWLADRGQTILRGPANPSMNYECGLLIDGFDSSPTFMMTYNPPYYADLWEAYGFRKSQDMYAFYARLEMLDSLDDKLRYIYREAKERFHVELRGLDPRRFDEDLRMFLEIYNRSQHGSWGFVPLSHDEITHTSQHLKWLIVPELTSIAEVDGKPIGAMFGLMDYNPRIRKIDGRLFPFGFLRLIFRKRSIRRMRLISTNVLPEYQRWGIGLLLTGRLLPICLDLGMHEGEFSWVLESNDLSYKTLKKGGARLEKTFRMYDWTPDVAQPATDVAQPATAEPSAGTHEPRGAGDPK